jgi:phospholipid/cholesterol/gamma-HCH transport system ATP-binding protein
MIRLEDVHKSFGANRVLRGVNLEVKQGETLTIIGGSGTGKSVILKHIVGLMRPDKGRVFVDDVEISRMNEHALFDVQKKFGFLFQGAALFDSLRPRIFCSACATCGRTCTPGPMRWWKKSWALWD